MEPPDHMRLPIREVFQETVAQQARYIPPVVITFVRDLFLKYRADRNYGCEGIPKNQELKEELMTQLPQGRCKKDHCDPADFYDRREQLKDPQIGHREKPNSAVTRAKQHIGVLSQRIE